MTKARDLASGAPAPAGVSTTELGYVDGVTSAIQTQINTKSNINDEFSAGKNKIINGDFGVWQRGTSFTMVNNTNTFTADRMRINAQFTGTAAVVSQQTFTPGTAPVAGYEGQYFLRYTAGGTTAPYFDLFQPIEDVRTFAGQTVTLSFWAKSSVSQPLTPYLQQQFGSGGSGVVTTAGSPSSTTTSWARYSFTIANPSISGKTIGTGSNLLVGFSTGSHTVSQTIDIWGLQIEAGSTATPFQTATGTKQGELAACQRYLPAFTTSASGTIVGGYAYATNNAIYMLPLPVNARVAPTGITLTGNFEAFGLNTAYAATPAFNGGTVTTGTVTVTSGLTITAGQGSRLSTNGAATMLFTGCEF
jgi:hypothetical protein